MQLNNAFLKKCTTYKARCEIATPSYPKEQGCNAINKMGGSSYKTYVPS